MLINMNNENLIKAQERAEYHASMSKLEYVVIIEIISEAKEMGKKLNFPQLFKEIQKKYGEEAFADHSIRYYVKAMSKSNIIKHTKDGITLLNQDIDENVEDIVVNDENEIALANNDYYEPKLLPEKVTSVLLSIITISTLTTIYAFYIGSEKLFDVSLSFIICVSLIFIVFYLDAGFDVIESVRFLKQKILEKFQSEKNI